MMKLNVEVVRQQISNLLLQWPELEEDDVLRADSIEGETDAHEFLRLVEEQRREATAMAGACSTTIAELEVRRDRFVRREHAMRKIAFQVMEAADLRKIEMAEATYSIRNGSPKLIVTDDAIIPDILCRIKREPDKKKIADLLKQGNEVQGAILSNAEPTLSIRTK